MDLYDIRLLLSQGKSIYDLPLKVTYYARVSTEHDEQLNSLANQVMYFEKHIREQSNWTFVEGYVDEGISGTSVRKREQFLEMIDDAKDKKFNLILTKEISRFSRSTLDSIKYSQKLLSYGIGIHFMSDNINTFMPDSELRLTIMSSIAQEEVRKLSDRVKFGYQRTLEKGIVAGNGNIYGYYKDKADPGKLFICEDEAELIKLIYDLYITDNIGTTKLGLKLYHEYGYKNSNGKPIHGSTIRDIIRNPKYKGYYCGGKTSTIDYRTKQRKNIDKEDWVVYKHEENVPAIVSEKVWEKANKIIEARSIKHSNKDRTIYYNQYPLSKKIYCYHDNATFIRGTYKLKFCTRVYWGCDNYQKYGKRKKEGCNTPIIYDEEFAEIFRKVIKQLFDNENQLYEELTELVNESVTSNDYPKEKRKLLEETKVLENDIDELLQMRIRKEIDLNEFNRFKEKVNNSISTKKEAVISIDDKINNNKNGLINIKEFKAKVSKNILNDDESILKLASTLFDRIYVENIKDEETHKKAKLHIKLNIFDYEKRNFYLSDLSLLFQRDKRFCSSEREKFSCDTSF